MTVVVGVSGPDRAAWAIREAARLATGLDEPLHAVHVLTESELEATMADSNGDAPPFGAVRSDAGGVASAAVSNALAPERGDGLGVDVETVGLVGDPATELVEYATHVDASLIVVGGRKRSAIGKALFGSVTRDVLFEAEPPVVTCLDADEKDDGENEPTRRR